MESTRSKNRKHKNYTKQKSKSVSDDADEKEHLMSSVDKIRADHLATTPVSPVGNIVDMQGSLDHGSVDKNEDDKNENKNNLNKDSNKEKSESIKAVDNQEASKKQQDDKDVKIEIETVENNNSQSESIDAENKVVASAEIKNTEKEVAADQKNTTDEVSESSVKSVSESQGICHLKVNLNNFQVFIL